MLNKRRIFKKNKTLAVDEFVDKVLYDRKFGYYSKKNPFGNKGDFITSPLISNLFGEMLSIWIINSWENLGKPKNINIVELGPGNGFLTDIFFKTFKNFKNFYHSMNIYLYEKSFKLKKIQQKKIRNSKVKWISSFSKIKKGPILFIGNEFFDALPVKQFKKNNELFYEKKFKLSKNNKIIEVLSKAKSHDIKLIKKFKSLKNQNFFELPKKGFNLMEKITKKIIKNTGGVLLIDYGYLKSINRSTLQSVKSHKKNQLFEDLTNADITSLVNFNLLKEYFIHKKLKVKKIVSQKFFLERLGILERANIISKNMNFREKADLFFRIKRLIDPKIMGKLFKVIFAYKSKKENFVGFN
jgi:NADH dehydrogenase [ubiquinone] 1 alpha subcomplex assembly factor 7|tara:strand:+ start:253 stop:1317 length:1065 start_codon:yes stop_codon:yes gene_type:complete